ncbi:tyrosine-type recombinase/integrase (plasmid) [Ralstonia syzygii subsp. celebesensis]|uniref:tyrosine-type recombinase/integrase n=1 Tax=Ralstonia syzygii TaxID=28097 RepID=UPI00387E0EEE
MNARRRKSALGLPSRVYVRGASFYWVRPSDQKWIRLCRVDDGQRKMLARLADEIGEFETKSGTGNMPLLIAEYVRLHKAEHREKAWPTYGKYSREGFKDDNVHALAPADISEFLKENWAGKLHMQRVMRSFLSGFFEWCIGKRMITVNPCREVKLKKPKVRDVYIPDAHFLSIRQNLSSYVRKTKAGKKIATAVPAGDMMQCFVDLCYLTAQRSTEIRLLRWKPDPGAVGGSSWVDWDAAVIHFVPTKTEDSSAEAVDWPITDEIKAALERARSIGKIKSMYVIHSMGGKPYKANSLLSAWKRAARRAELLEQGYTIKDIRAKALTDAERAGYSIGQLQVAAAHTDPKTTEIYVKARTVPISEVRLRLPKAG